MPALVWEYTRPQPAPVPGTAPATTAEYPWVVVLGHPGAYPDVPSHKVCVGTLVAPRAVVTAGHCLARPAPSELTVTAGRDDLRGTAGQTVAVVDTWVDPAFVPGVERESFFGGLFGEVDTASGDIGLALLAEPLPYPTLPMATARDTASTGGTSALRLGWRLSPQDEPVLWQAPTEILDDPRCVDRAATAVRFVPPRLHGIRYDTGSYLCAGDGAHAVPLRASDSGAPLVVDGRLVGVASWSPGVAPTLPDYFARVATYEEMISARIAAAR